MPVDSATKAVLDVQAQLCTAVVAADRERAAAALHESFLAIGHAGNLVDKTAYLNVHFSPKRTFVRCDPSPERIQPHRAGVLVTGTIISAVTNPDENAPLARYIAWFVETDTGWQIASWQETPIQSGLVY